MADSILDIKEILNDYSHDIQEALTEETQLIAKEAVKELKVASPKTNRNLKNKGRYARSWTVNTKKGRGYINCTVWNSKDYRLTHLLEKPHLTRNGSLTKPIVHIAPIEEKIIREYQSRVEKIIENGGIS